MEKTPPEQLYLDLMKKVLSYSLWPEPPILVEPSPKQSIAKRSTIRVLSTILRPFSLAIARKQKATREQLEIGQAWPALAETMVGKKRLDNIQYCVETVIRNGIEGDLIETGVWRGGSCIFMRAILEAYGIENRRVFAADSFEGLPKPNVEKYPQDKDDILYSVATLRISLEEVQKNFDRYGLLDDKVVFLKGWFKDTLATAPIEKIAVMRLDGDMYESTMDALNGLYSRLSVGGFCIIDDYILDNCKAAVDEFREVNGITAELKVIDWTGRYWVKEQQ